MTQVLAGHNYIYLPFDGYCAAEKNRYDFHLVLDLTGLIKSLIESEAKSTCIPIL